MHLLKQVCVLFSELHLRASFQSRKALGVWGSCDVWSGKKIDFPPGTSYLEKREWQITCSLSKHDRNVMSEFVCMQTLCGHMGENSTKWPCLWKVSLQITTLYWEGYAQQKLCNSCLKTNASNEYCNAHGRVGNRINCDAILKWKSSAHRLFLMFILDFVAVEHKISPLIE